MFRTRGFIFRKMNPWDSKNFRRHKKLKYWFMKRAFHWFILYNSNFFCSPTLPFPGRRLNTKSQNLEILLRDLTHMQCSSYGCRDEVKVIVYSFFWGGWWEQLQLFISISAIYILSCSPPLFPPPSLRGGGAHLYILSC
jgi:hypothetical protein